MLLSLEFGFDVCRRSRPARRPACGIDLMAAAELLGLGRTTAYKLVRTGGWPTPVIRIGRLIKIPTAPLRDLLTCSPASRSN